MLRNTHTVYLLPHTVLALLAEPVAHPRRGNPLSGSGHSQLVVQHAMLRGGDDGVLHGTPKPMCSISASWPPPQPPFPPRAWSPSSRPRPLRSSAAPCPAARLPPQCSCFQPRPPRAARGRRA